MYFDLSIGHLIEISAKAYLIDNIPKYHCFNRLLKNVVFVIDVPELPFMSRDCMPRRLIHRSVLTSCDVSKESVLKRQDQLRLIVRNIKSQHPGIRIYDPLSFMCNAKTCKVKINDILVYRDSHHLSIRGSELFANNFIPWLLEPAANDKRDERNNNA